MKLTAAHRHSPRLPAIVLLALFAASTVGHAMAQGRGSRDPVDSGRRSEERQADHRALADAVRRVERATRGEVLSAERVQSDGRDVSRVKVVDASGRVRVYMDDAQQPRDRRIDRTRRDDSNND